MRLIKQLTRLVLTGLILSLLSFALLLFVTPTPQLVTNTSLRATVNDVTGMNPINVDREVAPTSLSELQAVIRGHDGPISIGGGRFSMGGQIAAEGSLHIDMRKLNRIIAIDAERKQLTVQAGATWRSVQEALDPYNLSIKVMQSYSNFTVGGSLAVNAHGRYVGQGPIIGTVRSIRVVTADGRLVDADREKNSELFYSSIGAYGALGVIAEATLELATNDSISRTVEMVPLQRYETFFLKNIRDNAKVIFQNGDLLATGDVMSVTWKETDAPVTINTRLAPADQSPSMIDYLTAALILEVPFGRELRAYIEPYRYGKSPVMKRNLEAGYDIRSLGTISTPQRSFALQEYFVPVERMDAFAQAMMRILSNHEVDYLNVSIRHAMPDTGSLLSWAPRETFAFVLYYRQDTSSEARRKVGIWTRELIDQVLANAGSYYLPYQIHARKAQFLRAYPRAPELFALKDKLDPGYKFRNKLWDAYYRETLDRKIFEATVGDETYLRRESQTYLTLPAWDLVFMSADLAETVAMGPQSTFPFMQALSHFWYDYVVTLKACWTNYGPNWGFDLMNLIIGVHTSAEYFAKWGYENTIGRFTEALSGAPSAPRDGTVDAFIRDTYLDYAAFIRRTPWYEYPFLNRLEELWKITSAHEVSSVRHYERKISVSVELGLKAMVSKLFAGGSSAVYEKEDRLIGAVIKTLDPDIARLIPEASHITRLGPDITLLKMPRCEAFTQILRRLAKEDLSPRFLEIAGNKRVAATLTTPLAWKPSGEMIVLSQHLKGREAQMKRVNVSLDVSDLISVVHNLLKAGGSLEHVFDY